MSDPIFIVGNSRSGTTLISRILKNHPNIYVLNETHLFEEFSSEIECFQELDNTQLQTMINSMITIQRKDYYRKSEYEEYPIEADKILSKYEQETDKSFAVLNKIFFYYEAGRQGKKRAGDQTPRHVFYVDDIFLMYPCAKVVHMVRDPRAVLFSQKKKWASGLRSKQPLFEVARTFINYHPITMSILWCKAVSAGLAAEKQYGSKNVKTLFFEELVKEPEVQTRQLCEFLGVSFVPEMIDVDVELSATASNEGKKGISSAVADQWQNGLSKTEVFICEKHAGELMKKMGYQLSEEKSSWFHLGAYLIWLPFHLGTAFLMNITRMGNPIKYIAKRFF